MTRPGPRCRGSSPSLTCCSTPESADPAAIVTSRQDLRLALIAALQYLPGRQRSVLILRDVLMWRAAEVAELLGISTVAVNSMLQRARAGLRDAAPTRDEVREPADVRQRALVDQYAAAIENADVTALMRLLQADATFEMPPQSAWFLGREQIGRFLASYVLREPGDLRTIRTSANGQPALAVYQRDRDGAAPRARRAGPHLHGGRRRPHHRLQGPGPVRRLRPPAGTPRLT